MPIWSWIRDVVADRGEQEPVAIHLERVGDEGYAFRLGVRAGFGGGEVARVPVARRMNDSPHPILKEIYSCEVAGQELEAANVHALRAKVARLLESLAPARTLPLCEFRVPAMDYALPVYEHGGEFVSPVLGGPRLRGRDLAELRAGVARYLISAGYVHHADEIVARVVRPRDLRGVPPAAVLRSHADPELWIPTVEGRSEDGPVVGVVGQAAQLRPKRRRPRPGFETPEAPAAPDIVALLRFLRTELTRAGHADAAAGLHACEVRREIWARAEARSELTGSALCATLQDEGATRLELPVRRTGAGDVCCALEDRGIHVFLEPDEDALAARLGRHLARGEFLRFEEEIAAERVDAPRAERLEADSIRTLSPDEPEEVHLAWH